MWWKFSKYEVVGGYIQPTPDAVMIAYDPWESFQAESSTNRGTRPYMGFLKATGDLMYQWRNGLGSNHQPLLDWVHQFGLLGLFWHETLYLQEPSTVMGEVGYESVCARSWSRVGGRWQPNGLIRANGGLNPPKSGILVMTFMGPYSANAEVSTVPFRSVVKQFFTKPSQTLSFDPSDPDCLRHYREPIEWLVESVHCWISLAVGGDAGHLNYLLAASSDWVEPPSTKGRKSQTPASIKRCNASLLAFLGWMLVRDQADGQRILTCPCGKDYLSNRYQSMFCSDSCRSKFHKRVVRAKAKKTSKKPKRADTPKQLKGTHAKQ